MSKPAIVVTNLSKAYRIGMQQQQSYRTFRDAMIDAAKSPFRRFRDLGRNDPTERADTFWALKDVSFEVQPGEVVGIIGRNGAGKSTMLKILSRITEPTSGRIAIRGRVASLLEVGTGFHPELSGRENIYLNGSILGMRRKEIDRQFDAIIDFAEIERFLDTPVKRYSSGMYVRLAFAVAAHLDPEILVVDEVLAVGDVAFQRKCLQKMGDVALSGRTVLFVSHDMTSILKFCEKSVLLSNGQLAAYGRTARIVDQYLAAGADSLPVVDLTAPARRGNLRGKARLISAKLNSDEIVGPWRLKFGSRLSLEITAEAMTSFDDLELGIGLFAAIGFEIASTLSSYSMTPRQTEIGRMVYTVVYKDLVLTPGLYTLGIGLRSDQGVEDYLREAVTFEIVASESAAQAKANTLRGAVVPDVQCTVQQVTNAQTICEISC